MKTVFHIRLNPKIARYFWGCRKKIRYGHAQTAENAVRAMEAKGSPGLSQVAEMNSEDRGGQINAASADADKLSKSGNRCPPRTSSAVRRTEKGRVA